MSEMRFGGPPRVLTPFGRKVRDFRIQQNVLLGTMCAKMGITASEACRYELGELTPTKIFAVQVADALFLNDAERQELYATLRVVTCATMGCEQERADSSALFCAACAQEVRDYEASRQNR